MHRKRTSYFYFPGLIFEVGLRIGYGSVHLTFLVNIIIVAVNTNPSVFSNSTLYYSTL